MLFGSFECPAFCLTSWSFSAACLFPIAFVCFVTSFVCCQLVSCYSLHNGCCCSEGRWIASANLCNYSRHMQSLGALKLGMAGQSMTPPTPKRERLIKMSCNFPVTYISGLTGVVSYFWILWIWTASYVLHWRRSFGKVSHVDSSVNTTYLKLGKIND
jgi:hypothetical protein